MPPTLTRPTTLTAPGWSAVAGSTAPSTAAANSGLQSGLFGTNTDALFALYERAIAAGMSPSRASQLIGADISPDEFLQQIEQLETTRATLGTPTYTPARASEQTAVRTQGAAEGLRAQLEQQAAALAASRQLTPEQQAIEDRFGHDMAWLDPSFQRSASTITPITTQDALQYGTTADPAAQAQQQRAIDQLFGRANAGASGDERFAMGELGASINRLNSLADQGASSDERQQIGTSRNIINRLLDEYQQGATGEERQALDTQRGVTERFLRMFDQGATDDERDAFGLQRDAIGELFGQYRQGATATEREAQDAQRRVLSTLFGLYDSGGQDAQDRAARARARADSENWLLGQRQADMQDLAERGMSGSGAEIASLAQDRQAAASRLSMADLEADSAAEARRMQALMNAQGTATQLQAGEGQIAARALQALLGASAGSGNLSDALGAVEQRRLGALGGAGTSAASVTGALGDIQDRRLGALGTAQQGSAALTSALGGIENRGLQARLGAADAAGSYGNLAGSVEGRALEALLGAERGAGSMRAASDAYVGANANRLLDASTFNAQMIDRAAADNTAFLQNAYRDTMADRLRWDMQTRDLQTGVARDLFGSDVQENEFGFGQGYDTAASDVAARNRAQSNYNQGVLGMAAGTTPIIADAAGADAMASAGTARAAGQAADNFGRAVTSYISGGMGRQPSGAVQQGVTDRATQNLARNPWVSY